MSFYRALLVIFTLALSAHKTREVEAGAWKVVKFFSRPVTESTSDMTVELKSSDGRNRLTIRDRVLLSKVKEAYVYKGKTLVFGEAGNTQGVGIYEITSGKQVDFFYCYQPQYISKQWIAFIQYYPNHTMGNPTDVVMIYDLDKGPRMNRLDGLIEHQKYPTRVGIPVYGQTRENHQLYNNYVDNEATADHILGPPFFLLLSSSELLFLSARGADYKHLVSKLIAVDLSHGVSADARSVAIDLPLEDLKKPRVNERFLQASAMKEISPAKVRLFIDPQEYGVPSITVDVPHP